MIFYVKKKKQQKVRQEAEKSSKIGVIAKIFSIYLEQFINHDDYLVRLTSLQNE